MIDIVICDDEKYMLDKIGKLVVDFFYRKGVETTVLQFESGDELLKYNHKIDILFLDIQMNGTDGMETARRLRDKNYNGYLIFITVMKEMVFQAFEVRAYDYLLKPVEKEYFDKTMERLFSSLQSANTASLFIKRGYENRIIPFDDIVFCEIIDRKIYVNLKNGEIVDYYDKIERLEEKLDKRFFKCHRSYLINLGYLKSYDNGRAYMMNGKEIPISRLRCKEFSSVVLRYMEGQRE